MDALTYSFTLPMSNSFDPLLYELDKSRLESTGVPILTVSASFREDIKGWYGFEENEATPDVVFSRAHYSMAMGIAQVLWQGEPNPEKAWIVDPTNYVTSKDWQRVKFTEFVGKTIARNPILKVTKDFIDKFGRGKLPILKSIEPPLLYVTKEVKKPILSLHIATGNILAEHGFTVVQVVTDPHVREEYVLHADKPTMTYCVFDERTKYEFLEKAAFLKKKVDPEKVIVTGPPVDPRIITARKRKAAWRRGAVNLCLTTGGLGTNKEEIKSILEQLLPELRKQNPVVNVVVYAGTQTDIAGMVTDLAKEHRVSLGKFSDSRARLRLLYHPQITDANELLIQYAFPWADGFITKPSGDMAYDAVAAGCFLLTLKEWGVWEENIRHVFEQKSISRKLETKRVIEQLTFLTQAHNHRSQSWIETAMNNAFTIDKLFLRGSENILEVYKEVSKKA